MKTKPLGRQEQLITNMRLYQLKNHQIIPLLNVSLIKKSGSRSGCHELFSDFGQGNKAFSEETAPESFDHCDHKQ